MSIADGEVVAILGANGAGKTTLLRLMCGISKTDEGEIELHGKNIAELSKREIALKIAFLTQDGLGQADFTVDEFLKFSRYAQRRSFLRLEQQDFDAIEKAVKITGIDKFRSRLLTQLSGGEKQRIYIAGAIAQEAKIMLLDEPTTYLDPIHWKELAQIVRKLEIEGFTIVIATHSINFALRVCNRFIGL
ncbi:MAG: ABC transporter ATP-binding protein, partial [Candidatus Heimdallarchaeota archaeon]|nr:ABC transporter ATP-binding protein [Candidatus Heimdallarchaeota archaeon]